MMDQPQQLDELLAISRALSSERDIRKLLALILEKSRQITGADAGSVYVVEDEASARPSSRRRASCCTSCCRRTTR